MSEQRIQQEIRLALGKGRSRLWRNNTGALRDERGQLVRYGLCQGSADLIGLTTVTVTPDMVGQTLAVFTAIEVKAPRGRPTPEQEAFIAMVRQAGGRAGIARSVEEAERIITGAGGDPHRCDTVLHCQTVDPDGAARVQPYPTPRHGSA